MKWSPNILRTIFSPKHLPKTSGDEQEFPVSSSQILLYLMIIWGIKNTAVWILIQTL